ncbi:hypothetical protein HRG_000393 [Hirsutella rhossiliensis]|uniref:Uncharacterized protein n=1 Tax=Hirsutella rhossiliensis TaxID=111463 RepID=A0A9P8N861_9HYPO|nr:uncharacterized protein HRG_00393 [Hirsutella rhossiliensis]KAH0967751.1 hypothetical protein HRG_00393 [Hirsutella rhossiliensis]
MPRKPPESGIPAANMLSFAPAPPWSSTSPPPTVFCGTSWDHHRPVVSSPLSSSPVRATSPLSPMDRNALPQRQTQSSPIQPPPNKPFAASFSVPSRFASRPTRPNPLVRGREDARLSRRHNFLQRVRQSADDKAWQRRDIEGQFLKTSWLASLGRLSHDAPAISDADIEDATAFRADAAQSTDQDEMMVDSQREDDELEALVATHDQHFAFRKRQPSPASLSDEEYDEIFAELMSQEQPSLLQSQSQHPAELMDMSDDS